jgi:hypothetical protein
MSESTSILSFGSARLTLMETGTKNRSPALPRQVAGVLTAAYNLLMLSEDILLCLLRFTVSRVAFTILQYHLLHICASALHEELDSVASIWSIIKFVDSVHATALVGWMNARVMILAFGV